ncbi:MAG: UDP-3-O-(3-hydroxymyristoyl)glucosamine N-acyltransferase [Microcoleaceae cyanobacterium]
MKFDQIVQRLAELASKDLDSSLIGTTALNPEIENIAAVDQAQSGTLSYIEGPKFARYIQSTAASALILPKDETLQSQATKRRIAWVAASDPRLMFAQAINLFYQPYRPTPQIHPTAVIDSSATLGKNVYIGPYVVIQPKAEIGDDVCVHPNVVVYPQAEIGARTVLHANCTIHERTQIGEDCVVHSGAIVGSEGFGFVPTAQGWFKMEQSGRVVLEEGVEVGCNSTIDRPAVGETRIGQNTKLDNLVHIGHGCQIGRNCAFAGQVGLAGGVQVGHQVILAGQVGVANQAKIGDRAIATAQSGIHSTISADEIVSGSPAIPNKIFLKSAVLFGRLPEIYQSFKELRRRL